MAALVCECYYTRMYRNIIPILVRVSKDRSQEFYLSSHRAGLNYFCNPPPAVAHRQQVGTTRYALAHDHRTHTLTFLGTDDYIIYIHIRLDYNMYIH